MCGLTAGPSQERSADFQSAVSQNCILLRVGSLAAAVTIQRPADYKSAIQQIENLRYAGAALSATGPWR
jgi:hypothetical protein